MLRRKKSFGRRKWSFKTKLLIILTLFICLFIVVGQFFDLETTNSTTESASSNLPGFLTSGYFFQSVLKMTLPGFVGVIDSSAYTSEQLVNNTLMALVDINPVDPKTFISTEISVFRNVHNITSALPVSQEKEPLSEEPFETPPLLATNPETPSFSGGAEGSPEIIIYHAHTTESFEPTSGVRFTTNLNLTVVRLGAELKEILEENYGISVLQNFEIHDIPRSNAYRESRKTAETLLLENPQVKIVIDLHRDGVVRRITTAEIEGRSVGKILTVVGSGHQNWRSNQQMATSLHNKLEAIAPGVSRGIKESSLVYNQDLHPRAMLIEVGGHENSLEENLATIPYLAQALAEMYLEMQ